MIRMQENMSKTLDLYSKIYRSVEIPTAKTAAVTAIEKFVAVSQQQLNGISAWDSFYQSLQPPFWLQKVLDDYNVSMKPLADATRYWENVKNSLELQNGIFATLQPDINNNLAQVLERLTSSASMINMTSFQRLVSGIENVNNDLFDLMNEAYFEDEEIEDFDSEEGFTSNAEIHEALETQVNDPVGFQEKAADWTEKKKRQFFIVVMILHFFWSNFIQPYFQEYIGVPVTAWTVAHVKEIPEKTGKLIADLKEDIEAIIIENVPYYYKVSFIDEHGEVREGYVSKRSVKLIEKPKSDEPVTENIGEIEKE